jgi:hypothetical protein
MITPIYIATQIGLIVNIFILVFDSESNNWKRNKAKSLLSLFAATQNERKKRKNQ